MADNAFEIAALSLVEVRSQHRSLKSFPEGSSPTSVEDAYKIQDTLVNQIGGKSVGWKIGCTSKMAQESTNTDQPFYGRMFADSTHEGSGEISFDDPVYDLQTNAQSTLLLRVHPEVIVLLPAIL